MPEPGDSGTNQGVTESGGEVARPHGAAPESAGAVLPTEFCARPALDLAPALLGRLLVRRMPDGSLLSGRIVETEAYGGGDDAASHARGGLSKRNAIMFGPPGGIYVYLIYGMHHCLNFVAGVDGRAEAVLLRALEPIAGEEIMSRLRDKDLRRRAKDARPRGGYPRLQLTSGPGRLCAALSIDRDFDGRRLPDPELWLEAGSPTPPKHIARGPRVGVAYAGDAAAWPWRFWEEGNPFVSR